MKQPNRIAGADATPNPIYRYPRYRFVKGEACAYCAPMKCMLTSLFRPRAQSRFQCMISMACLTQTCNKTRPLSARPRQRPPHPFSTAYLRLPNPPTHPISTIGGSTIYGRHDRHGRRIRKKNDLDACRYKMLSAPPRVPDKSKDLSRTRRGDASRKEFVAEVVNIAKTKGSFGAPFVEHIMTMVQEPTTGTDRQNPPIHGGTATLE